MTQFIWQSTSWPRFRLDYEKLSTKLGRCRNLQGQLLQLVNGLGLDLELNTQLEALTEEVVQTAAIEGETFNADAVRSSVAKRLGLSVAGLPNAQRHVDGLVEVLLDATVKSDAPLSAERLKGWHAALFPTGYSGLFKITVADWRLPVNDPMRIVSGPVGRERTHYIAPPSERVEAEIQSFLKWWQETNPEHGDVDPIVRAAIAHYWFVAIHPFEDGNGRIARALADMALAQADGAMKRCYSFSAQIMDDRDNYYRVLESTSKGDGDLTEWLDWFLDCQEKALNGAMSLTDKVLGVSRFWQNVSMVVMNDRQRKAVCKLLEAGPGGFVGGLSSRKYLNLTGASRATGHRDLVDLVDKGVMVSEGGGRSVRYDLNWEHAG